MIKHQRACLFLHYGGPLCDEQCEKRRVQMSKASAWVRKHTEYGNHIVFWIWSNRRPLCMCRVIPDKLDHGPLLSWYKLSRRFEKDWQWCLKQFKQEAFTWMLCAKQLGVHKDISGVIKNFLLAQKPYPRNHGGGP